MKRQIQITDNSIIEVPLTRGMKAIADADDLELLSKFNWYCSNGYAVTNVRLPDGRQRLLYMHRLLMSPPEGLQVDHRDGDKLNNRRENLRVCSHAENQRNRLKHSDNSTGYKGVSWFKPAKRFHARIMVNGKEKHLGYYSTPQEAAAAYDAAANELHKEFARTNY